MHNWKDARNYRRFRDENGNVIANIIYVDGEEVAVSDEVYEAYASLDRRPWMRSWKKAIPKRHSAAQKIWRI